jgi:hypothetical protein
MPNFMLSTSFLPFCSFLLAQKMNQKRAGPPGQKIQCFSTQALRAPRWIFGPARLDGLFWKILYLKHFLNSTLIFFLADR